MALNKKMHPRNIYKHPPNFKELALKNEEFRKFAIVDIRGKVSIDFKDPAALRSLTRALLLHDWKLDVIIPPGKLVPTLPLRLNYILWIEDLLKLQDIANPLYGIDIGTGSSCIYPLLAAKKNSWHMIGSEKDQDCFVCAEENVSRNNMQSFITVLKVSGETIFQEVFKNDAFTKSDIVYHFSLCNPPFFASDEELDSNKNSRSQNRAPPHNARTGSSHEVIVAGGEVAFVLQMIEESLLFKNKVRIFSSMLGHKSSLTVILNALKEKNIQQVTCTEFCQGHVMRWGIAWSFTYPLSLMPIPASSTKKQKAPMRFDVPSLSTLDGENQLHAVVRRVKQLLERLEMHCKQVAKGISSYGYQVTAYSNTWSNQRRRRREQFHKAKECLSTIECCAQCLETGCSNTKLSSSSMGSPTECLKPSLFINESEQSSDTRDDEPPSKRKKSDDGAPLLYMSVVIREVNSSTGKGIVMEIDSLQPPFNRDLIYQVMQYFRNNLHD